MSDKTIEKYIRQKFIKNYISITLVTSGILCIAEFIKVLEYIVNKNVDFISVAKLFSIILFNLISYTAPLCVIITTIITFNYFYQKKELFIFKSSGMSRSQIMKPMIKVAMIITFLHIFVISYLIPYSDIQRAKLKVSIADNILISLLEENKINKIKDNLYIYINKKKKDNSLLDVLIYSEEPSGKTIIRSEKAKLIRIKGELYLGFSRGSRIHLNQEYQEISKLIFAKYFTNFELSSDAINVVGYSKKLNLHYTHELFTKRIIESHGINKVISEFFDRILWPILNITFLICVITILLAGEYNRHNNYKNYIVAIISSLFILFMYFTLRSMAQKHIILEFVNCAFILLINIAFLYINKINRIKLIK